MAWSAPRTWAAGEVVTAAQANTELRDNLRFLKGLDGTTTFDAGINLGTYFALLGDAAGSSTGAGRLQRNSTLLQMGDGTNVRTVVMPTSTGTIGDVLYHDGTNWTRLTGGVRGDVLYAGASGTLVRLSAVGASGSFLRSSGTAGDPVWAAPAAGAITNAGSGFATATGTLIFTLSTSQTFQEIWLFASGTAGGLFIPTMRLNGDANGSYSYRTEYGTQTSSITGDTKIDLAQSGTPQTVYSLRILIYNQTGTGKIIVWDGGAQSATAATEGAGVRSIQGVGYWNNSGTVGTITFIASGTNFGRINAVVQSRD